MTGWVRRRPTPKPRLKTATGTQRLRDMVDIARTAMVRWIGMPDER